MLCVGIGRRYHETLLAHGVKTGIALIPPQYAASYCTGSEGDPASEGSPYLGKTSSLPPYNYTGDYEYPGACGDHTLGFAAMVKPLTQFLVEVLDELPF